MTPSKLAYLALGTEAIANLVLIPYMIMAGGVTILATLGFPIVQSFPLFMATASIVGFPWFMKVVCEIGMGAVQAQLYRSEIERLEADFMKTRPYQPDSTDGLGGAYSDVRKEKKDDVA